MGTISIGDYGSCYLSPISGTLKESILKIFSQSSSEEAKEKLLTLIPPAIVMKIFNTLRVSDERKMEYLKRWHCHLPYPRVPYKAFYRKANLKDDIDFQRLIEKKIYFIGGVATPKSEVLRRKLKAEVKKPDLIAKQARAYIKTTALKQRLNPRSKELTTLYFQSISARTVKVSDIKKLIYDGLDINSKDSVEVSVLGKAIARGKVEVVQSLLQAGADPNLMPSQHSASPLFQALKLYHTFQKIPARKNDYHLIIQVLINAGATIDTPNRYNSDTPLIHAVIHCQLNTIKSLVAAGADLDATGSGRTATMHAASGFSNDVLQVLIAAGANLNIQIPKGVTALSLAIDSTIHTVWDDELEDYVGRPERLELLQLICDASAYLNFQDTKGQTGLMVLATKEHVTPALNILIKAGANLDMQDNRGRTALMIALEKGCLENAKSLILAGANVNIRDCNNVTALELGALFLDEELLCTLVELSEDMNHQSTFGKTALMAATLCGNEAYVLLLLAAGADPNLSHDYDGDSILMKAAARGSVKVVRELIKAGADTNYKNISNITALTYATTSNKIEIVKELIQAGAILDYIDFFGSTALMYSIKHSNYLITQELIKAGANLDIVCRNFRTGDETILMRVVSAGRAAIMRELIKAGANVHIETPTGSTAFLRAASGGRTEIMRELVKAGVHVDTKNKYGETALLHATHSKQMEMVQALLAAGARTDIKDRLGKTVIDYANPPIRALIQSFMAARKRERDEEVDSDDSKIQRSE